MFKLGSVRGGLLLGAATLAAASASAQDGGVQMTFGLSQRIDTGWNVSLDVPETGNTTLSTTRLSFGLVSQTELSRLVFDASSALLIENSYDTDGTEAEFGSPDLSFGYTREIPNAIFEATARYRSDDVDAFDDSLEDEDASGTRTDLGATVRLETGRTAPFGFVTGASYDAVDYEDTTDPDLVDTTFARANVEGILRFSEVAVGRLGLSYAREEEEDTAMTLTETTTVTAGIDYAVSQRLDVSVSLGYATVDTEEFGVTETSHDPVGRVGMVYDMPVGILTADLSVTRSGDEEARTTFVIGREMELPTGALVARIGASSTDAAGTDLVGLVSWTQELPNGELVVRVERTTSYDEDDDETTVNSVATVDWTMDVNTQSSVGLDFSYEVSDDPSERIEQTEFGATYTYALTPDWALAGGARYTVREDIEGRADSPSVFLALSRDFNFRP